MARATIVPVLQEFGATASSRTVAQDQWLADEH
jgi:hypothetical protein